MDGCVDGWVDGRVDGCVGSVDGWLEYEMILKVLSNRNHSVILYVNDWGRWME